MTKKHFKAIAQIIDELHQQDLFSDYTTLVDKLCVYFKACNANFNTTKFREACNVNKKGVGKQ